MLDKIYPTKELTKEKRHELEIEVEELKLKQKQHDEEYNKTLEIVCKRLNELDSKKT
jgi:hypothetical protein